MSSRAAGVGLFELLRVCLFAIRAVSMNSPRQKPQAATENHSVTVTTEVPQTNRLPPSRFMSESDAYFEVVLARHVYQPNSLVSYAAEQVIGELKDWAGTNLNRIAFIGSVPKATAISGTTDLDVFVSLKENTPHSLREIYEKLYNKATAQGWNPRRQSVSIGISVLGVQFDLVPGRLQPGYTYFHSLWKRKEETWQQTAPEIHVDKVKDSGRTKEIRALKIWRKNHGLDFPSFYLELTVMKALSGYPFTSIASNFLRALDYIAIDFPTATFEDPANTNNMISDDLTQAEKKTIAGQAKASYDTPGWSQTIW